MMDAVSIMPVLMDSTILLKGQDLNQRCFDALANS
jgi:hypothetical protein